MMRWVALSLLLVPCLAQAADFWDGSAALQRGDAAFESGLNATSNSFPPGTQITVSNQAGKSVTVTVTGRIAGQSDILVLLSPKAAEALGLAQGSLERVRVTVPPQPSPVASAPSLEQVSRDPDVNPAAGVSASDYALGNESASAPSTVTPTAAPQEATAAPEAPETIGQETAAAPQAAATPESTPPGDEAAILSEAESRVPQKQVFLPPREDQKFAYHPETAAAQQAAQAAPQGTASVASVVGEPGVAPPSGSQAGLPLAVATPPEESRPVGIVASGTVPPAPSEAQSQVALALPEVASETSTTVAQAPARAETPPPTTAQPRATAAPATLSTLPRSAGKTTYYLQVGAFGTEEVARNLAARLTPTYPAQVLAPAAGSRAVFRVVIGPLNRDESGSLLLWFRHRGFPDAFLRQE